ncbi:MAG: hypothetical protein ACOC2U_04740 [bacterium]
MQLYYTTSAGENEEQLLPQTSLGGFKSSTAFRNDDFDNMFGEISTLTLKQDRDQYIALMLVNEEESDKNNIEIWIEKPEDSVCNFQIAAVDPAIKDDIPYIERTREMFNKPVYANFVEADENSKASAGTLTSGSYLGIWVKRSLNKSAIAENEDFYEEDPDRNSMYREKEKQTVEKISLNISWD